MPMSLVTEVDGIIERLGGMYKEEGNPGVGILQAVLVGAWARLRRGC
jgi:hypothetical protein